MLRKKKIRIQKKGISPMIATILLIGFVIAIIILLVLWGKNYIEELAEKRGLLAQTQQQCTSVKLEIVKACWRGSQGEVAIKNLADIPIYKFVFTPVGKSGEPVEKSGADGKLKGLETKSFTFEFSSEVGKVDSVNIVPYLRVVPGRYVPCSKEKVTAKLTSNC